MSDSAPGGCGSLAVVILAGGEGRRIGGGKPLRVLGERTLLDRAIERARSWSDTVAVAARDAEQVGDTGLLLLIDPPGVSGPLAGLAAARELGRELVLTIPCDMPFLPLDLPAVLAAVLPDHGAALASGEGRPHPVCGLWTSAALDGIEAYAATSNSSLIGFARSIGFATAELDAAAIGNINSLEDLVEAEARLS